MILAALRAARRPFSFLMRTLRLRAADPRALLSARSIADLRGICGARALPGFNGQVLRLAFAAALSRKLRCTSFVETGTYVGDTTLAAHRYLGLPVYSCEIVPRSFLEAQLRTLLLRDVHLARGDSTQCLLRFIDTVDLGEMPFFYLDAHAGGRRLPLAQELTALSALPRFACLIDDFQVPGKPGFGYDTYAGQAIDLSLLRAYLPRDARVFLPAHTARDETGARRGSAVIVRGRGMPSNLAQWGFPFTLFDEASVEDTSAMRQESDRAFETILRETQIRARRARCVAGDAVSCVGRGL